MKISEEKLRKVVAVLRSFGATRVLLFGSCVRDPEGARDVDLAVEGIPLGQIWRADGAVTEVFDTPCDLVVREETPGFYEIIRKRAKVLYEQAGID